MTAAIRKEFVTAASKGRFAEALALQLEALAYKAVMALLAEDVMVFSIGADGRLGQAGNNGEHLQHTLAAAQQRLAETTEGPTPPSRRLVLATSLLAEILTVLELIQGTAEPNLKEGDADALLGLGMLNIGHAAAMLWAEDASIFTDVLSARAAKAGRRTGQARVAAARSQWQDAAIAFCQKRCAERPSIGSGRLAEDVRNELRNVPSYEHVLRFIRAERRAGGRIPARVTAK